MGQSPLSTWGERVVRLRIRKPFSLLEASLVAQLVKNLPAMQETQVQSLCWEDALEKGSVTHSNILAWRIPWTEEAGRLQPAGSQRVGHDWAWTHKLGLEMLVHSLCSNGRDFFSLYTWRCKAGHIIIRAYGEWASCQRGQAIEAVLRGALFQNCT